MPKILKEPVKVLQIIHGSGITGPGKILYNLVKNLDKNEFIVDVLCPQDGSLAEDLKKIGVRVISLDYKNLWSLKSIARLIKVLRKEKYAIFHNHSGQLNSFAKILSKLLGVPLLVFTEHFAVNGHPWIKNKFRNYAHRLLHWVSNMMVDRVIAVSAASRDSYIKRQNINPRKVTTIYNGVDINFLEQYYADKFAVRAKWNIPKDTPLVGMVGRLTFDKAPHIFVLAAKEVVTKNPEVKFIIIGEGPQRGDIEKLINQLELNDHVILAGFQKEALDIIETMDILVQPSLDRGESFGLAVVEAMCKQKPVIVSDLKCFREFIRDGINGIFFPVGGHLELAQKLEMLLADKALAKRLGQAGRQTIKNRFSAGIMAGEVNNLYKEALASKGFYLQKDYYENIKNRFVAQIGAGNIFRSDVVRESRMSLDKFFDFIKNKRLNAKEMETYLAGECNFIIEEFLKFIEKDKIFMENDFSSNVSLFKKIIREKPVVSKDYDERIRMQTIKFQISNYYFPENEASKRRIDVILSALCPEKNEKILDLGCGVGTFVYHSAKHGAQAAGIDYSQESIEMAKKLTEHFGLSKNAEFQCCDVTEHLPYPDGYFDKIVAADFIEHINDSQKDKILSEMSRVIKPGGIIVIFTPNAFREKLGEIKSLAIQVFGKYAHYTRLHYGLINRFKFEKMLKARNLKFERRFVDVTRPYLARIFLLKEILSLEILWIIKK